MSKLRSRRAMPILCARLETQLAAAELLNRQLLRELRVLRKLRWRLADQTDSVAVSLKLRGITETNFSKRLTIAAQPRLLRALLP